MKEQGEKKFLKKLQLLGVVSDTDNLKRIKNKIESVNYLELDVNVIKILIIEDHILIAESYALALGIISKERPNYKFEIDIATSCEKAIPKLKGKIDYDIILLDISLPPYPKEKIYSGEDISLWIDKNLDSRPKIIINTCFVDHYRLYNLYENVNPDGFLTKEEADAELILEAIITVIESPPFYSNFILKMVRKNFLNKNVLDDTDRKILYELSQGATTKNLMESLAYSKTSIERKKKNIFEILEVRNNDLRTLIEEAKRRGFI